jgi:hypothetical protein
LGENILTGMPKWSVREPILMTRIIRRLNPSKVSSSFSRDREQLK